jgi:hypothetical protein
MTGPHELNPCHGLLHCLGEEVGTASRSMGARRGQEEIRPIQCATTSTGVEICRCGRLPFSERFKSPLDRMI